LVWAEFWEVAKSNFLQTRIEQIWRQTHNVGSLRRCKQYLGGAESWEVTKSCFIQTNVDGFHDKPKIWCHSVVAGSFGVIGIWGSCKGLLHQTRLSRFLQKTHDLASQGRAKELSVCSQSWEVAKSSFIQPDVGSNGVKRKVEHRRVDASIFGCALNPGKL